MSNLLLHSGVSSSPALAFTGEGVTDFRSTVLCIPIGDDEDPSSLLRTFTVPFFSESTNRGVPVMMFSLLKLLSCNTAFCELFAPPRLVPLGGLEGVGFADVDFLDVALGIRLADELGFWDLRVGFADGGCEGHSSDRSSIQALIVLVGSNRYAQDQFEEFFRVSRVD
jgi:hypothetical protein